jgi:hypothetical protein
MPVLIQPLALFGLLALPALLLVYSLYSRFRRREVSALFLWLGLGRQTAGRGLLRKTLPPWSFWLECLMLACLSLAAAGLCWPTPQRLRPLVVVLDDSLSLQATVDGSSARSRAEALLRREVRRLQPTSVRVALAGRTVHVGPHLHPRDLGRALGSWRCLAASADLAAALGSLRVQDPGAWVLVLTDHPPPNPVADPSVRWLSVGLPTANAGIVNAARTALGAEHDRVLVDVRVFGQPALPATLTLRSGGQELRRERLDPARESHALVVTVPADCGTVDAELSADALVADNRCALPAAWRPSIQPFLDVRRDDVRRALLRAIAAAGLQVAPSPGAGVTFTDAPAAASHGAGQWRVRFHTQSPMGGTPCGPFVLDRSHPLCEGLDLDGVIWSADAAPGEGLPVVLAGDVALLRDREFPGGAHCLDVSLDPDRSTLLQSPAWPILVWNLLHWQARTAPGFGSAHACCGQWVRLTLAQAGETARLTLPDGTEADLRPALGSRELGFVPELPGLYRAHSAAGVFELACLPGVADESDLRRCATSASDDWSGALASEHGYWNSATLIGLLAAAALAVHGWLLYRRRRGQADLRGAPA